MVSTPEGEWYYASLCARPWNRPGESIYDPRGWSTLGRETAIKKYIGMKMAGRVLKAVTAVKRLSRARKTPFIPKARKIIASTMNLLRQRLILTGIPCGCLLAKNGYHRPWKAHLNRRGSLANTHDLSLIARRWQAFILMLKLKSPLILSATNKWPD